MALETLTPTTRRSVLAAAFGALAAFAAQAIGRPLAARAADGEAVLVGGEYTATSVTKITSTGSDVFHAEASTGGTGIYSSTTTGSGVFGQSTSGSGVFGYSPSGNGLNGQSVSGYGVYGLSGASDRPAMLGKGVSDNTGVLGFSGSGEPPAGKAKTGVYGYAVQDAASRGVTGESASGRGLNGLATTGRGVHGEATTGTGVYAIATTGTALRAEGAVRFKTSGLATIAAGTRSVTVTPAGLDLTTSSKVLPSLQGDAGGSTVVQRVAVNATANSFTIYLTANSVRAVKVSWFVIS
jgi:hypothetical protein